MIQTLIQNATLLITLSFLYGAIKHYLAANPLRFKLVIGTWFGIVAIAAMMMPHQHEPGVIYDGRSIVITLAGLWGGAIVTLISVVLAAAYRLVIGGAGVWAGVATIAFCGLTGLIFRRIMIKKAIKINTFILYGIGFVTHLVMLASQLLLPAHPWLTLQKIGLPILLVFPLAFLAIAKLFQWMDQYLENEEQIRQAKENYRVREYWLMESQRVGKIGSYRLDIVNDYWTSSPALDQIFGIDTDHPRTSESWKTILHPDFREEMMDYLFNEVIGKKQMFDKEYMIVRKNDACLRWVHGRGELRYNEAGDPVQMIGTIQDITDQKLAREELINSEERFRMLILNAPIPVMVHNEDGQVLYLSEGWTHFSGYNIEDIPTISDWTSKVYSKNQAEAVEKHLNDVLQQSHSVYSGEFEIKTKNGNTRVWNFYTTPLRESGGKKLILSMAPDITQRIKMKSQLEESEQAYRLLFENHIASKLLINPANGKIIKANKAAAEFYGYSIGELEQMNIGSINVLPAEQINQHIMETTTNKRVYFEFQHRLASGEIRDVEVFTSEAMYMGQLVLHSIIHDITDKKQLMHELVSAKEKAEESERLKSAFLANVSHEIRTPLNGIVGFSNILSQNDDLPLDKKREFADIINKSSESLLKIINDILDLSRLETGKTSIDNKPFDVNAMLQNIYAVFQNRLVLSHNSNVVLSFEKGALPLVILADEGRLTQVFSNLLDNAIRFTSKGKITFGVEAITDDYVEFFVSDTGIGIPADKQEMIFGRFAQAESGTWRSYGGTGLGLSIVKKLLELMGSEIHLESEPGTGTRFWFRFPLAQTAGLTPEKQQSEIGKLESGTLASIKKLVILVVDDDEATCLFFKQTLEQHCSELHFASTGKQALGQIKTKKPDVVLLDIGLPDFNGLDVAREIRKTNREVKIIAQTAFAMAIDLEIVREAGCNDLLIKPINSEELFPKLA